MWYFLGCSNSGRRGCCRSPTTAFRQGNAKATPISVEPISHISGQKIGLNVFGGTQFRSGCKSQISDGSELHTKIRQRYQLMLHMHMHGSHSNAKHARHRHSATNSTNAAHNRHAHKSEKHLVMTSYTTYRQNIYLCVHIEPCNAYIVHHDFKLVQQQIMDQGTHVIWKNSSLIDHKISACTTQNQPHIPWLSNHLIQ